MQAFVTRETQERFEELLARAATAEERASLAVIVNEVKAALGALVRADPEAASSES